uniref:Uncharacterized protein n=1 Tax=Rhizophora mucronata TaxID=61149 RepID=A0A2P2J4F0_RHIMU
MKIFSKSPRGRRELTKELLL